MENIRNSRVIKKRRKSPIGRQRIDSPIKIPEPINIAILLSRLKKSIKYKIDKVNRKVKSVSVRRELDITMDGISKATTAPARHDDCQLPVKLYDREITSKQVAEDNRIWIKMIPETFNLQHFSKLINKGYKGVLLCSGISG